MQINTIRFRDGHSGSAGIRGLRNFFTESRKNDKMNGRICFRRTFCPVPVGIRSDS